MANYISKHDGPTIDIGVERGLHATPQNLLLNGYFARAINTSGQTQYTGATETINGWTGATSSTSIGYTKGTGITFNCVNKYNLLIQNFSQGTFAGRTLTVAALDSTGKIHIGTAVYPNAGGSVVPVNDGFYIHFEARYGYDAFRIGLTDKDTKSITIKWVAAYDGAYTSETLPNYVPPNPQEEQMRLGQPTNPVNLLDNSNFANLIAQAGFGKYVYSESDGKYTYDYSIGMHGSKAYAADRWLNHACTVEQKTGYARVTTPTKGRISQNLQGLAGKTITAAAKVKSDKEVYVGIYYVLADGSTTKSIVKRMIAPNGILLASGKIEAGAKTIDFRIYPAYEDDGGYCDVYWAALYEGAYTEETLPVYTPKPYNVELSECQRYYENSWFPSNEKYQNEYFAFVWNVTQMDCIVRYRATKRSLPTVNYYPYGDKNAWMYYTCGNLAWVPLSTTMSTVNRDALNQLVVRCSKDTTKNADNTDVDPTSWSAGMTFQVSGHWEAIADILE